MTLQDVAQEISDEFKHHEYHRTMWSVYGKIQTTYRQPQGQNDENKKKNDHDMH